jgi:ABC-type transport system involved in multi-copper enzyme maturation permease subunit
MTFLPIVERELREAARRHITYAMRLFVAAAAILTGVFFYIANVRSPPQAMAQAIFVGLSVLALIYCLTAGRSSTADCLSREKREGTLGLLFLTQLKGYDVVLGKMAATSLNGFFCLVAILPILAIPLLMGGIAGGEFWRMAIVLLVTFLYSLAIGVFVSALSWHARRAMGANFLLLLLLSGTLPACAGAIAYFSPSHTIVHGLLYPCPLYTFYLSSDTAFKWQSQRFWASLAVIHGLTWLLVASASRLAPHRWQDQPSRNGPNRSRKRWSWTSGDKQQRTEFRKRLLEANAFYWLAARSRFKPLGVWVVLLFVALWWLFMRLVLQFKTFDETLSLTTAFILNLLFKLWIAIESVQRLAEDQKNGALELLLSTPLTVRDIVHGQLLSLRRQFLIPLLAVLATELFLIQSASRFAFPNGPTVLVCGIGGALMLLADIWALIGVAICTALHSRSPNHASVSTISRVLILPSVLWGASALLSRFWILSFGADGPGWKFYFGLWFALGLSADLLFGFPAWWRLRSRFRQLAAGGLTRAALKLGALGWRPVKS